MSGKIEGRIQRLETGFTPKQAILMWLQEAHGFNGIEEYARHLTGQQPESAYPIHKLTGQTVPTGTHRAN